MTSSTTTHVNSGRRPHFYIIFMFRNYLVYFCTYVYLRVLNQYGTHWNKNTPTTAMIRTVGQLNLLSICTGILGNFDILQFEISSLMNWIFFLVWKQTGYFYQFKLYFFPSFWARVKYFDGSCSTIHSLFTIYRVIHYQLLVWWIHYTHCCESKKLKTGKSYLCSLWNNIFNYPNWDFGFC